MSFGSRDGSLERNKGFTSKVSERFAVVSMPGAYRRAKSAVYGHERIPNDPLLPMRTELTELDHVLQALEGCGRTCQAAVEMLASAPTIMLDKLQRFFPEDAYGHHLVLRFAQQQGLFTDRLKRGLVHVEELYDKMNKMREDNAAMHEAFRKRDEVFTNTSHYERKVESLRGSVGRSSGNSRLVDKLNRNESKRFESQQALQEVSMEVEKGTEALLDRKLQRTGEAIACVCRYYSDVFAGADRMNSEMIDIADTFSRPPPMQDVMRKGKEYASQARERAAHFYDGARDNAEKFTAGARERLSGATAAMSSKWQSYGGGDASGGQRSTPSPGWGEGFGGFGGGSTASGTAHGDASGGCGAQAPWGSPQGPPPGSGSPTNAYTGAPSPWGPAPTAGPPPAGPGGGGYGGFGNFGGFGSGGGAPPHGPGGYGGGYGGGTPAGPPPNSGYGGFGQANTPWGNPPANSGMRR
mmetsp:Transcript_29789/g.54186  ORF Transcript_29789/g.54186 Transcript_29789/m.54186 type:complete len:467 (+) Transcript_29789:53-1453(+)